MQVQSFMRKREAAILRASFGSYLLENNRAPLVSYLYPSLGHLRNRYLLDRNDKYDNGLRNNSNNNFRLTRGPPRRQAKDDKKDHGLRSNTSNNFRLSGAHRSEYDLFSGQPSLPERTRVTGATNTKESQRQVENTDGTAKALRQQASRDLRRQRTVPLRRLQYATYSTETCTACSSGRATIRRGTNANGRRASLSSSAQASSSFDEQRPAQLRGL